MLRRIGLVINKEKVQRLVQISLGIYK
ncbi:hypothetical protein ACWOA6_09705 [Globicatella sulfidifaciens]